MPRMSVSFSKKNEEWLLAQVETGEYASKSEVINSLLREKRERQKAEDRLMAQLEEGRSSGISDKSIDDIFAEVEAE